MRQTDPINESPRLTLLQFVTLDRLDAFERSILDSKTVKDMRDNTRELLREIKESVNVNDDQNTGHSQSTSSIQNLPERIFSTGLQYIKNVDNSKTGVNDGNEGLTNGNLLDLFGDNNV